MLTWDLKTDTVDPGQWLKGTVKVEGADLSPDGRYLVYEAANYGQSRGEDPEGVMNWTAVSRPPYWTALVFRSCHYANSGGGYFRDRRSLVLSDSSQTNGELEWRQSPQECPFKVEYGSLPQRLEERPPWQLVQSTYPERGRMQTRIEVRTVGGRTLRRMTEVWPRGRCRWVEDPESGNPRIPWSKVGWADFDPRERLVYAIGGCLYVDGVEPKMIVDLNRFEFEAVESPAWARGW